ncbi:MAG TPA: hypothetical protein VER03_15805 [Bryobacteraceae bacterium]|nr:hypothetical protein [Bryobacteraceae bacterium]
MGKKKQKAKDKPKDNDRPGRKDLAREIARLQAQNEALRARLERIAEIATADPGPPAVRELALVDDDDADDSPAA